MRGEAREELATAEEGLGWASFPSSFKWVLLTRAHDCVCVQHQMERTPSWETLVLFCFFYFNCIVLDRLHKKTENRKVCLMHFFGGNMSTFAFKSLFSTFMRLNNNSKMFQNELQYSPGRIASGFMSNQILSFFQQYGWIVCTITFLSYKLHALSESAGLVLSTFQCFPCLISTNI